MEKTSKKTASESLEETLKRLNVSYGTTFPVSLLRSKKSGQVLYLEAGKDFVDTLLSFLLLPLGTILHMLPAGIQVKPALGGISSIFESVQNFSAAYLQLNKELLVRPRPAAIGCACKYSSLPVQLALESALILPCPKEPSSYYTGGFMKVNTTFIITDGLEIMPLTTIQSVSVLSKLKIASLAELEGHNITVSLRQVLQLLHSSLSSNTCLNDVFGARK